METPATSPTIEMQRDYLARQRIGYRLAERLNRQRPWSEPSADAKLDFDQLMADAYRHFKYRHSCGLVEYYAKLLKRQDAE